MSISWGIKIEKQFQKDQTAGMTQREGGLHSISCEGKMEQTGLFDPKREDRRGEQDMLSCA